MKMYAEVKYVLTHRKYLDIPNPSAERKVIEGVIKGDIKSFEDYSVMDRQSSYMHYAGSGDYEPTLALYTLKNKPIIIYERPEEKIRYVTYLSSYFTAKYLHRLKSPDQSLEDTCKMISEWAIEFADCTKYVNWNDLEENFHHVPSYINSFEEAVADYIHRKTSGQFPFLTLDKEMWEKRLTEEYQKSH